ncbi:hypothetical protein [Schaalia sp. Marseille-Q2122]|uniref:hypothetical protein n=1 Tax=Schaalia sp. Marseille-Q2122 TaxID=2736604 RepID=UPI00158D31D3|nr:hypothetical protein [Schaalia sp. Marseille-Q2122]
MSPSSLVPSISALPSQMSSILPGATSQIATRVGGPDASLRILFNLVEGLVIAGLIALVIAVSWWVAKRYLPTPPAKDLLTRLDENLVNGRVPPEDYARIRAELIRARSGQSQAPASPAAAPFTEATPAPEATPATQTSPATQTTQASPTSLTEHTPDRKEDTPN